MTIGRIVCKSLRQHLLSTTITALSIALAGGLLLSVWVVREQSQATFTQMNGGYDAVLGTRSSPLQLVLNAIFHLEQSPGNIPIASYDDIKQKPVVQAALPIAVGDSYRGYRVVGTLPEFFDVPYAASRQYRVQAPGRIFNPAHREAVVGSFAAAKLGLRRGDTFHPEHGLAREAEEHEEEYLVVGILEPSNTPTDRVIWIPLEGLQQMSGHDPAKANDLSAVLVKLKTPIAGQTLDRLYNKEGGPLTFAWPIDRIIAQLLNRIAWVDEVLKWVACLVALVATGSVLASIYNSMSERRRDIAILRALGARRWTVFASVVLEASAIAAIGMVVAFAAYAIILSVVASIIRAQTGVVLEPFKFHLVMIWAPAAMMALSAAAGIIPALKAYRTDVAEHLAPIS